MEGPLADLIHIQLIGPMRKPGGLGEHRLESARASTVRAALLAIGYREEELPFFTVRRAEQRVGLDEALAAGDNLTVLLPVGGG